MLKMMLKMVLKMMFKSVAVVLEILPHGEQFLTILFSNLMSKLKDLWLVLRKYSSTERWRLYLQSNLLSATL